MVDKQLPEVMCEVEVTVGEDLDHVIEALRKRQNAINVVVTEYDDYEPCSAWTNFNGDIINADMTDDEIYLVVTGYTKDDWKKKKIKHKSEITHQQIH